MEITILAIIIIFGILIGSFNNVLIHRIPRNESIVKPGSRCFDCHKPLKWYDNIPLVSYLVLRGRCRYCGAKIPFRYFLVELLTGVMFGLVYLRFGLSADMVLAAVFVNVGIIIVFIDRDFKIIPDTFILILLGVGLANLIVKAFSGDPFDVGFYLFGLIIGFLILFFIRIFGELIYKREALGLGDVKLLAVGGFYVGWPNVFLTLLISSVVASIVELTLIALKIRSREDQIPFGPYLMIGLTVALFFGTDMISWYLSLMP
ncbi:MAG: prepilin peptidase [Acholeplasmataceae bacterium]|nr:prepilin peptidase [Acholeplasmataceae bacterium]